jgi:orotate phosphoribosyltransferase
LKLIYDCRPSCSHCGCQGGEIFNEQLKKLQEVKLNVLSVMSIFSYGFTEIENLFKSEHLPFHPLSTFDVLARVAYDDHVLDAKTLDQVLEWRKSVVLP